MRHRGPRLNAARIQTIVEIIDGLPGVPTWNAILSAISKRGHWTYTRQALCKHERIRTAFLSRRTPKAKATAAGVISPESTTNSIRRDRIDRLVAEVERLTNENNNLLAQYALLVNALARHGVGETELRQPLKRINWK